MFAWGGRTQSHDDSKYCATESSVSPCVMDLSGIHACGTIFHFTPWALSWHGWIRNKVYLVQERQKSLYAHSQKLPKATITFFMSDRLSVRMEQLGSHYTDFFENVRRKSKFNYSPIRLPVTFILISRIILKMRNFSYKSCTENQNTHFMFSIFFPKIVSFVT